MATTVGVIRAIGVVMVPPAYLDSPIERGDEMLNSDIDTQKILVSNIKRVAILDSDIDL
jgi:hypothetical protein